MAVLSHFVGIRFCPNRVSFAKIKRDKTFFAPSTVRGRRPTERVLETGSSSQRVLVSDNLSRTGLTERQAVRERTVMEE